MMARLRKEKMNQRNVGETKKYFGSLSGTTMIEVLVAFMIVVIMTALFAKSVRISADFLNRSRDMIAKSETFDENYYKTDAINSRGEVSESTELIISIDMENTESTNKAKYTELVLTEGKLLKYTDTETQMIRYSIGVKQASTSSEE